MAYIDGCLSCSNPYPRNALSVELKAEGKIYPSFWIACVLVFQIKQLLHVFRTYMSNTRLSSQLNLNESVKRFVHVNYPLVENGTWL